VAAQTTTPYGRAAIPGATTAVSPNGAAMFDLENFLDLVAGLSRA
jgi:hypothetical protein